MKPIAKVLPLLFASGSCALLYQLVWLREFRLIFGTSTAASAAVLGVFMGGLGLGSLILGKRAEAHRSPLTYYGKLELLVAGAAAISPVLLAIARSIYLATGGTLAWGMIAGTILRIVLTVLVLGLPTFFMGGTFPAAAKAVSSADDEGRSGVALLYGANALGAVSGVLLGTFWLFERLGNQMSLSVACLANLAVALLALWLARTLPAPAEAKRKAAREPEPASCEAAAPVRFVCAAAAITGFAFMLLEMVWYRMLSPLLGGSTFTFGLILAAALLGMGLGGAANAIFGRNRQATLHGFALTCGAEAFLVALPFALGDRLAVLTGLLQPLGVVGFPGQVLGWSVMTCLVVLPASFLAGIQFPALISLLGRAGRGLGDQAGRAYAWNMAGAITGSLAGGFGILPWLSAPRTWQLVAAILAGLGFAALFLSVKRERRFWQVPLPAGLALAALALLAALGPTAVWRHSPIGAGRANLAGLSTRNELLAWMHQTRRGILWQVDGVESSVGVSHDDSISFLVNGKSDGSARYDAGTQVMCGLVGAILHPNPQHALVVGLGTGSTAGWLAAVPSMQRVDAVELEPAIVKLAALCAPVNHDALNNPKLKIIFGDAREIMLTTRQTYDVIASEPSNPYRAGVASLFTKEFYAAAAGRLTTDGRFCQWVQAYEVDSETIRTIYTTMSQVFLTVETWQTLGGDMLFVASKEPVAYDSDALRQRLTEEPFKSALANAWRVASLEGFLARYIAGPSIAAQLAESPGAQASTDDHNILEYAFARSAGRQRNFEIEHILRTARSTESDRPTTIGDGVDWDRVATVRISLAALDGEMPKLADDASAELKERAAAQVRLAKGDFEGACKLWFARPRVPAELAELSMVAQMLALTGDERARKYIDELRATFPAEAEAILGMLLWQEDKLEGATQALASAFVAWRTDPWALNGLPTRALKVATTLAREDQTADRHLAARLFAALDEPFAVHVVNDARLYAQIQIAALLPEAAARPRILALVRSMEPHVPWRRTFLRLRADAYAVANDPRKALAAADLELFLKNDAQPDASKELDHTAPRHTAAPAANVAAAEHPGTFSRPERIAPEGDSGLAKK